MTEKADPKLLQTKERWIRVSVRWTEKLNSTASLHGTLQLILSSFFSLNTQQPHLKQKRQEETHPHGPCCRWGRSRHWRDHEEWAVNWEQRELPTLTAYRDSCRVFPADLLPSQSGALVHWSCLGTAAPLMLRSPKVQHQKTWKTNQNFRKPGSSLYKNISVKWYWTERCPRVFLHKKNPVAKEYAATAISIRPNIRDCSL